MIKVDIKVIVTKTVTKTIAISEKYIDEMHTVYFDNPDKFIDNVKSLACDGDFKMTNFASIESGFHIPYHKLIKSSCHIEPVKEKNKCPLNFVFGRDYTECHCWDPSDGCFIIKECHKKYKENEKSNDQTIKNRHKNKFRNLASN